MFILPTHQEENGNDCGCHAIATEVEFLSEDGDPLCTFDIEQMHAHIVRCLEAGQFTPFPRSNKRKRGRKPQVSIFGIDI